MLILSRTKPVVEMPTTAIFENSLFTFEDKKLRILRNGEHCSFTKECATICLRQRMTNKERAIQPPSPPKPKEFLHLNIFESLLPSFQRMFKTAKILLQNFSA